MYLLSCGHYMFIDSSTYRGPNGKRYSRVLLRSSHRENGKVVHRTLGNLSSCSPEEIQAVRLALQHKEQLTEIINRFQLSPPSQSPPAPPTSSAPTAAADAHFTQGPSVGALILLSALAKELGISEVLGEDRQGKLALWQVIARALDQGSRLSAVRLARDLGAATVLDLPSFDEDDLYDNLAWLENNQSRIESELFSARYKKNSQPSLFLYDVTSTYLEGQHNALAAFGYNRDGKRGKKQIVVGLLCDEEGQPVAIEAFPGNTGDTRTVSSQLAKLKERFHAQHITLVGDRGMLRGPQIKQLQEAGFHHISAISKPQIETMLAAGIFQMELFDDELAEVIVAPEETDGRTERYILRRNPVRQEEIRATRANKKVVIQREVERLNSYLSEHPRAQEKTARKNLEKRLTSLGVSGWLSVEIAERKIRLTENQEALEEMSKLDGCYVLRTDLRLEQADKHLIHARYKGLTQVEEAFRRGKTVELEMRPVHVRRESSTRGHMLVVMLAYQLMKALGERWAKLDVTVAEGLDRLNTYCAVEVAGTFQLLLEPRKDVKDLLEAAGVTLPNVIVKSKSRVSTKRKLPQSRPRRSK